MEQTIPQDRSAKESEYGEWMIHPWIVEKPAVVRVGNPIWRSEATKHEGTLLYYKLWNFWVRAGVDADLRSSLFFRDYEVGNRDTHTLLEDVGFPWKKTETEEQVWDRIGLTWKWLQSKVQNNGAEYSTITSVPGSWPSIADYARYYVAHSQLVWAACFSKAHLFVTLLGRMVYPRYRFAISTAHHTENGAPPTASHVYAAVYVAERWFYLDPTAVYAKNLPDFAHRASVGVDSFATVDYEHPFKVIPVPLSGFTKVPLLSK